MNNGEHSSLFQWNISCKKSFVKGGCRFFADSSRSHKRGNATCSTQKPAIDIFIFLAGALMFCQTDLLPNAVLPTVVAIHLKLILN
jgi:hypothetical protein